MQSDSFAWASIPIRGLVWVTCDAFPLKLNSTSARKQIQRRESPILIKSLETISVLKITCVRRLKVEGKIAIKCGEYTKINEGKNLTKIFN